MADSAYVASLVRAMDPQGSLARAFRAVLDGGLRFGRASGQSVNHGIVFLEGETHETADTEFVIRHGLGRVPYALHLQSLPLDTVGVSIVPLTVTRAADAEFIYLSSSVEGATIRVGIEV
jgi:hypothetical protein